MAIIPEKPLSNSPYRIIEGKNDSFVTLYLDDCLKGMINIASDSVDVVITSPPYNIGIHYNSYSDKKPRNDYLYWINQVGREIKRILKDDGSFFLNIGNKPRDQWLAFDVASTLRNQFTLQNTIHWIKSIAIDNESILKNSVMENENITFGHFKPIVSNRFLNDCHEYIFHFTKEGNATLKKLSIGVPYQDKSNINKWKTAKEDRRDRGNTWFIPYETIQKREQRPHPATFPVKLPEMCIKLHGLKNSLVVMDPFLGIGSTAIASHRLGVSFIGFEIDQEYIDEAIERLYSEMNRKTK